MELCTPILSLKTILQQYKSFARWEKTTQTVFSIKAKGALYLLHL